MIAAPTTPVDCLALQAVARGWSVFPLVADRKVPATRSGHRDAACNSAKVAMTWAKWPNLNVGVATGSVSGLVVLDVDGDVGRTSLARLEAKHGPLPVTYTVRTASGGLHLYFEHPGGRVACSVDRAAGLDVRGDGGYVVGAGSVVGGRPYMVARDVETAPLPDWLRAWLDARESHASRARSSVLTTRTRTPYVVGDHPEIASSPSWLSDAEKVAAVLALVGRPGVVFRDGATEKFRCPLHDHEDAVPSARLFVGEAGQWRFRCFGCATDLTLVELFASVTVGRLMEFRNGLVPTAAVWLLRMWHEAAVDPVALPDADLPSDLTRGERRVAEGFLLLRALRHHAGHLGPVPYTFDSKNKTGGFAAPWSGVSAKTVQRALAKLRACGFLRVVGSPTGVRVGLLYELGDVIEQSAVNPFATAIPWPLLDDASAVAGVAVPFEEFGDARVCDVAGQHGDALTGKEGFPGCTGAVEVHTGPGAVDELDDLVDVVEVVLAERVAEHGGFDAARCAADDVGLGHGARLRRAPDGAQRRRANRPDLR